MVLVEHSVLGLDQAPLVDAEDAVGVVSVLADAVQLLGVRPGYFEVFAWNKNRDYLFLKTD